MYGKGYGMPSSHAQFMSFFGVYLTLFLIVRHTPGATSHLVVRMVVLAVLAVGAVAVAASRIYLNYHTLKQVLVGSTAGVVCAVGWFAVTSFLREQGWIEWGLEMGIARLVRLRDLVVSEDLAEAGWLRWEEKRKLRRKAAMEKSH